MRKDLLTQETFKPMRITQKFARAENRIRYHNKKATALRHHIASITKPLHKNLLILNRLLQDKKDLKVHRQFLIGAGFCFNVMTHYKVFNGEERHCVFDYMIILQKEDEILIKRTSLNDWHYHT